MADIFLSYANEDRDRIKPIIDGLEREGWRVFWDRKTPVGMTWEDFIEEKLLQAKCVVVVWSKVSVNKRWVKIEARNGLKRHCLIPLRIDPVEAPFGFADIYAADLSNWSGDSENHEWQILIQAIERIAFKPIQAAQSPPTATQAPVTDKTIESRKQAEIETPPAGVDSRKHQSEQQPHFLIIPDIDWVEIPGGEFIYGEKEAQQTLSLPTFEISRYPITNAQYQAFIDDGGYREAQWWEELKQPEIFKSRWPQPNRPRTNLDWYEATAFCRWLAHRLNKSIRLPDEVEWERAARGYDGRVYPWGNEYINGYANVNESDSNGAYLEQITAVGLYPNGASPEGVMDLAGNVWEWCRNEYDQPESTETQISDNPRVWRGGAWTEGPNKAHSAGRFRCAPDFSHLDVGFRVLCSDPINFRVTL